MMSDVESITELTDTQHGILVHFLSRPEQDHYLVQAVRELTGPLDLERLRRAVEQLHESHPALRTRFVCEGLSQPVRVVMRAAPPVWHDADTGPGPAGERERRWAALMTDDRRRGLRLDGATPCRWTAVRHGPGTVRLLFTHHHLLLDGMSLAIVWRDLAELYNRLGDEHQPAPVSPPALEGFLSWQAARDRWREEMFWRAELADLGTRPIEIGQMERLAEGTWGEQRRTVPMTPVRAFARTQRVSLNSVLHAAWAHLLSRYTESGDVVTGTVFGGRPDDLPEAQQMVGALLNTVPLRVRVPLRASPARLVREVHDRLTTLRRYQYTSLSEVMRHTGRRGDEQLFDSVVVSESYPVADPVAWGDAETTRTDVLESPHYPLTLVLRPDADEVLLRHDGRRFSTAVAARILEHFATLLATFVASPDSALSEAAILSDAERLVLDSVGGPARTVQQAATVPEAFRATVSRTPDACAVRDGDRRMTYRELDEAVDGLAARLIARGARPDSTVGIQLPPSMAAVVAILAIWRARATYLPLDPGQPAERLRGIVRDAGVMLAVADDTEADWADGLPVITVETGAEVAAEAPEPHPTDREDVAYVIYTSGSTGIPKGVEVRHGALAHYVWWAADRYLGSTEGDVPLHSSLAFDLGLTSILCPLAAGRTIVVAPPAGLGDLLAGAGRFAFVKLTPAHLHMLAGWPGIERAAAATSMWVVGGEALHYEQIAAWKQAAPDSVIINEYGPTEAVVGCCVYEATGDRTSGAVPIGRPIDGARLYVLDQEGRRAPVGQPGELFIAGPALATGYRRRPELTAECFVADFAGGSGRMYRTGDLACIGPDGDLHFLGRRDDQVKIRGYRVELGEIEAGMLATDQVNTCKVVLRRDGRGTDRVVAYAVPAGGWGGPSAVLGALRDRLPGYMVPDLIVTVEALPLTRNGKVDVAALPDPEWGGVTAGPATVAPSTPTQRVIAEIWAGLLGVVSVGVTDDFFNLGGHSLLAARVISDVHERCGVRVPLSKVFRLRTIGELAAFVDRAGTGPAAPPLTPVRRVTR